MSPALLIATWFGSGLLKPAPGTWGSLAAIPFAWAIVHFGESWFLLPAAVILFPIGVWAANEYDKVKGSHDASEIVVDEVVAVWITLAFVPFTWQHVLAGFLLFRFFDILKPWPISWADRQVSGGFGVMIDDVIASLYAVACLFALGFLITWIDTL